MTEPTTYVRKRVSASDCGAYSLDRVEMLWTDSTGKGRRRLTWEITKNGEAILPCRTRGEGMVRLAEIAKAKGEE